MIGAILDRLTGSGNPERLPRDLVLALERASVMDRGGAGDEDSRILIHAAGLGSFHWHGLKPAAERIARHYPDLSPSCCRYAARLLATTIASRNRSAYRRVPERRSSWTWDF